MVVSTSRFTRASAMAGSYWLMPPVSPRDTTSPRCPVGPDRHRHLGRGLALPPCPGRPQPGGRLGRGRGHPPEENLDRVVVELVAVQPPDLGIEPPHLVLARDPLPGRLGCIEPRRRARAGRNVMGEPDPLD